jgi:acyl dehydratase
MTAKQGWTGRFFEDFEVGDVYQHPYGRTITEADNVWFTNLTLNTNQLHFNTDYAARTEFKRPLVNSCLTLAMVTGMSVADVSQNAVNLEWTEVRMPHPLYVGDTLYADSEVLEKRESRSRPSMGIVTIRSRGVNQNGKVVLEFKRTILVYKKEHAPQMDLFPKIAE